MEDKMNNNNNRRRNLNKSTSQVNNDALQRLEQDAQDKERRSQIVVTKKKGKNVQQNNDVNTPGKNEKQQSPRGKKEVQQSPPANRQQTEQASSSCKKQKQKQKDPASGKKQCKTKGNDDDGDDNEVIPDNRQKIQNNQETSRKKPKSLDTSVKIQVQSKSRQENQSQGETPRKNDLLRTKQQPQQNTPHKKKPEPRETRHDGQFKQDSVSKSQGKQREYSNNAAQKDQNESQVQPDEGKRKGQKEKCKKAVQKVQAQSAQVKNKGQLDGQSNIPVQKYQGKNQVQTDQGIHKGNNQMNQQPSGFASNETDDRRGKRNKSAMFNRTYQSNNQSAQQSNNPSVNNVPKPAAAPADISNDSTKNDKRTSDPQLGISHVPNSMYKNFYGKETEMGRIFAQPQNTPSDLPKSISMLSITAPNNVPIVPSFSEVVSKNTRSFADQNAEKMAVCTPRAGAPIVTTSVWHPFAFETSCSLFSDNDIQTSNNDVSTSACNATNSSSSVPSNYPAAHTESSGLQCKPPVRNENRYMPLPKTMNKSGVFITNPPPKPSFRARSLPTSSSHGINKQHRPIVVPTLSPSLRLPAAFTRKSYPPSEPYLQMNDVKYLESLVSSILEDGESNPKSNHLAIGELNASNDYIRNAWNSSSAPTTTTVTQFREGINSAVPLYPQNHVYTHKRDGHV